MQTLQFTSVTNLGQDQGVREAQVATNQRILAQTLSNPSHPAHSCFHAGGGLMMQSQFHGTMTGPGMDIDSNLKGLDQRLAKGDRRLPPPAPPVVPFSECRDVFQFQHTRMNTDEQVRGSQKSLFRSSPWGGAPSLRHLSNNGVHGQNTRLLERDSYRMPVVQPQDSSRLDLVPSSAGSRPVAPRPARVACR